MPTLFSRACEYAFQAVLYMARNHNGAPLLQRDISSAMDIPPHFLGKVLQILSRNGLVVSRKGKTGGFLLARPPADIRLRDIIDAIDGPACLDDCVLGFPKCGDDNPCPVHTHWKEAKGTILAMVENRSVGELSKELDLKLELYKEHKRDHPETKLS